MNEELDPPLASQGHCTARTLENYCMGVGVLDISFSDTPFEGYAISSELYRLVIASVNTKEHWNVINHISPYLFIVGWVGMRH